MRKIVLICLLICLTVFTDPVAEATMANSFSLGLDDDDDLQRNASIAPAESSSGQTRRQSRPTDPRVIFAMTGRGGLSIQYVLLERVGGDRKQARSLATGAPLMTRPLYQDCERPLARADRIRLPAVVPSHGLRSPRLKWKRCASFAL